MPSTTFAARAGRWSARHRKIAIWGWLAFVLACAALGQVVGTNSPKDQDGVGDTARAQRIVDDHWPKESDESIIVQGPGGARGAEVRSAVRELVAKLRATPGVADVRSPLDPAYANQVSGDGRSVLVNFKLPGDEDAAEDHVGRALDAVAAVQARHPDLRLGEFGGASASKALSASFSDDFAKAEQLSIPITLVILILAFGALVAAGVPLLLGLTAVFSTLGLVAVVSQAIPMDETISSVVLLVGMAVGVDYTLFYLRREREERRAGRDKLEAIDVAAATSGRAVLVSGLTVMVAMAGMLLAGNRTFTALGIGAMLVVAVAMVGSVTVVPAFLAVLGDRVDRGRVPFLGRALEHRRARVGETGGAWGRVLDVVLRRPALSIALSAGLLVVLALPALHMHTATTGVDDLPRSLEVMRVYDRMQAAFPGGQIPAVVALRAGDVRAPQVQAAIGELERRAKATGVATAPITVDVARDHRAATISIPTRGDGADDASMRALAAVRGDLVPRTVGRVDGVTAYVTGQAAGSKDFNDLMKARAPLVVAFVLTLAFLLLLVTFRSIVIPLKAIVLNLLSVAASYGVLTWVFQDDHLRSLVGFDHAGPITSWLPMFLFVILFGLSMDYHVFIVSRIREAFDRGDATEAAIARAIKTTASTVTSAAIVMVAVFAIFATLSGIDFKQMGVGLATAILIDATIVRAVLLPATMKVLGDWNWYLPKRLSWLPRLSHEPRSEPALDRA